MNNRQYIVARKVDRKSPSPVYQQVADQLRRELMLGAYQEGDRFFSYRKLKEIYGIELRTAAEAVELLIKEKLLVKRAASGTYVGNLKKAAKKGVFTGNIWYVLLGDESFEHPFYFRLLKSIERSIDPTGLKLIVGMKDSFDKFFSWFTPSQGDGLILTGAIDDKAFLKKVDKLVDGHLVTLGAYKNTSTHANITVDIESGITKALEKALTFRIESLGIIAGSPQKSVTSTMIDSSRRFVKDNGLKKLEIYTDDEEDGWRGMEVLGKRHPDCVIVTEPAYYGVCRYVVEKKIACPDDIKIIRYGKEPLNRIYDELASINISSDTDEMGKKAVEMLLQGQKQSVKMKLEVN